MKEFAHPDSGEKSAIDINRALSNALVVSRNKYNYGADLETDFGPIPPLQCHAGELNQVFLNLLVNAAHAIGDVVKGSDRKGLIRLRTALDGDAVAIQIQDTGTDIPEATWSPAATTRARPCPPYLERT
jgi:signal transduction histidine kinase